MVDDNRPYAPAQAVVAALKALRNRNLPKKVTPRHLGTIGVAPTVCRRVFHALVFLALVDEDGCPSAILEEMQPASEERYRLILAEQLRTTYAHIFHDANPEISSTSQVETAFQPFQPASQHYRMAALLIGLCSEADMPVHGQPRLPVQVNSGRPTKKHPPKLTADGPMLSANDIPPQLHELLLKLLQQLPPRGSRLAEKKREAMLKMIDGALEFAYAPEEDQETEV